MQTEQDEQDRLQRLSREFQSIEQRLDASRQQQSMDKQQSARAEADLKSLWRNIELNRTQLQREQDAFKEQRRKFDQTVKLWEQERADEGFKQTVTLYEQLPAKQVKQMFMDLMDQPGGFDQVVQYLAAMQPRKAAGVLEQFKQPEEVTRAVALTERLRAPRVDLSSAEEVSG